MDVSTSMKTFFTLYIILFGFGLYAQDLFTVTGQIQLVSYYQGGMELPPEMMMPTPLAETKLYVVKYYGPSEKPKIITQVMSDENGKYEVTLPPGKYGFIQDKSEIENGTYLPGMKPSKADKDKKEMPESGTTTRDYWTLSSAGPFEVVNKDLYHVDITHYLVTICYLCP